ncbi:hypothetical protein [Mucilaginibacter gracilis]
MDYFPQLNGDHIDACLQHPAKQPL